MKKIILVMSALFVSIAAFSSARIPDETVLLKGIMGALPSSAVSVALRWDKTLVTTFTRDVDNVTVTVRNSAGEVVDTQTLDAKEFETVSVDLQNRYKRGDYIIEISSPEGTLMGKF